METFHMIVLAIATAVLILILTTVGVAINANARKMEWPPNSTRCPDGWTEESDNKCYIPMSLKNSGMVKMPATSTLATAAGYSSTTNTSISSISSNILWTTGGSDNKWHHAGTAKITNNGSSTYPYTNDGAVLIANNGDNFNYFTDGDEIAIELMLTKTYASRSVNDKFVAATSTTVPEYQYFKVKEVMTDIKGFKTILKLKRDETANGAMFGGADNAKPKITQTKSNSTTGDSQYTITYEPTNSDVKYYGRRIGIDFATNTLYKGGTNPETKCLRKAWAKSNSVEWDGVSNYNKC